MCKRLAAMILAVSIGCAVGVLCGGCNLTVAVLSKVEALSEGNPYKTAQTETGDATVDDAGAALELDKAVGL